LKAGARNASAFFVAALLNSIAYLPGIAASERFSAACHAEIPSRFLV
jgi:hypothetical protein